MITLEEAIESAVLTHGQQIIPLEAFSLDKLTIQSMLKQTLKEYQEYFPNVKTKTMNGTSTTQAVTMQLPDCIGSPMSIRFGGYPQVAGLNSRYDKPNWQWDFHTKTITTVMGGGPWIITYAADYGLSNLEVKEYFQTLKDEDEIEFKIRGEFKGKSLKITRAKDKLSMEVVDLYTRDGLTFAELEGSLGTGRICLNDLKCQLELDSTRDDQLEITYITKYLGVKELDQQNQEFLIWFASKLLTSIGSLKLMTQLDGMPFNIGIDDLRSKGLELINQVETDLKVQKQEFYQWAGNHY
jgi:hypothetical protein